MDREFWLARWRNQEIGFHQPRVNPWLEKLWPGLGVAAGSSVFVPLCGKSLDLAWLASQGHPVIGVELVETAVRAFYQEGNESFQVQRLPHMLRYTGERVSIFCGDFMDLTALHVPGVAAVYDRGGLVALPPRMRAHYADHLQRILPEGCCILLLGIEYDQRRVPGPPHSVDEAEIGRLFGGRCAIERLCATRTTQLPPRFVERGIEEAVETAYRLTKKS